MAHHELQHAVQGREGFAAGGSPQMFDMNKIADEVDINYGLRKLYESILDYKGLAKKHGAEADAIFADKYGYAADFTIKSHAKGSKKSIIDQIERAKAGFDESASLFGKDPHQLYQNLAGEAEARAVQDRMSMNMDERRSIFPEYAARDDLIIRGLMSPMGR
jgi:hypothetical protein